MQYNSLSSLYLQLRSGKYTGRIYQVRDLTRIDLQGEYALIIAVDSDGGIGPLPGDTVYCSAYQLGRFAIRVPLLEILASGAIPLVAFDLLTIKMEPVGAEILAGIRAELKEAGLPQNFPISGSTEDNVPTNATGIGTVMIGLVKQSDFRTGSSRVGDWVLCIGKPKSAPEDTVRQDDPEIVRYQDVLELHEIVGVNDILPVGSHGVLYEAQHLAGSAGLTFSAEEQADINLHKSGGPSTCVVVSCNTEALKAIETRIATPVFMIGRLSH